MRWILVCFVGLGVGVFACGSSDSPQSCNVDSDCTQSLPADCTPALGGAGADGGGATCHWFCSEGLCEVSS